MSDLDFPVPESIVEEVDRWAHKALRDAREYDNSEPLDESGIWSLHRLVASVYAKGFDAGGRVEARRQQGIEQRQEFRHE